MKYLPVLLALLMTAFVSSVLALDLTITIPDEKADDYVSYICKIYPNNEKMPDPEWVDPEDGSVAPEIPKYSDNQWAKEKMTRWLTETIKKGKYRIDRDAIVGIGVTDVN